MEVVCVCVCARARACVCGRGGSKRFSLLHSIQKHTIPEIPLKIRLKFSNKGCVRLFLGFIWGILEDEFAPEEKFTEPHRQLPI